MAAKYTQNTWNSPGLGKPATLVAENSAEMRGMQSLRRFLAAAVHVHDELRLMECSLPAPSRRQSSHGLPEYEDLYLRSTI